MSTETYICMWQGIEIQLTFEPNRWDFIAHLEVRSIAPNGAPLPIAETGYLSHFHPLGTVEQTDGTLVEQVVAWLDEEAKLKHWQDYLYESKQLSLF